MAHRLAALFLALIALPAHAERIFTAPVTVTWTAASGPVAGYEVHVSGQYQGNVPSTSALVTAPLGQLATVAVRAFSAVGTLGPMSDASEPALFTHTADLDGNGVIGISDLGLMRRQYGYRDCGGEIKPACP